ncbi:MAG: DEAD/DEAH box helicase, partial [Tannerella sp.]|nr:DEAD/DEAH box helicase [Tannerella sp.]
MNPDFPVMYLPGVGPRKAAILEQEANIASCEDLLYYFPYPDKYFDRSRFYTVSEINGKLPYIQLKGRITQFSVAGEKKTKRLIAKFADGTGVVDLVWFKGLKYITEKYKTNCEYIVFGKPSEFGKSYNLVHPDIDLPADVQQVTGGLMPFYHTTEAMKKAFLHSRAIQNLQYALLSSLDWQIPETLPSFVHEQLRLIPLQDAIRNIHFPESAERLYQAQQRLKFDELFFIQLHILRQAHLRRQKLHGLVFGKVGELFHAFYRDCLPFALTNAQKRVMHEMRADMRSGRQMNRLLQGDVGSGKTLVALMAMLLSADNRYQSCLMAPTEILAQQHYRTLKEFLKDLPVRVALLTGSTRKKERDVLLPAVAAGEIQILVGTHALIEETVVFASLGLAVIDEQHRFGVAQRSRLWTKNLTAPHVLIMSATPIPRTLA